MKLCTSGKSLWAVHFSTWFGSERNRCYFCNKKGVYFLVYTTQNVCLSIRVAVATLFLKASLVPSNVQCKHNISFSFLFATFCVNYKPVSHHHPNVYILYPLLHDICDRAFALATRAVAVPLALLLHGFRQWDALWNHVPFCFPVDWDQERISELLQILQCSGGRSTKCLLYY